MKLIVGLGNPGNKYRNTRHNVGFSFLDFYLQDYMPNFKEKFEGLYYETMIENEKVIFLKPQTYMNESGRSVIKFINFYKLDIDDILIISDDLDQKIGSFRLKSHGSCGGHNGLRNIEEYLKNSNYKRLKIGIGSSNNKISNVVDYVLGEFSKEEKEKLEELKPQIKKLLDDYFKIDFSSLMNNYNRRK